MGNAENCRDTETPGQRSFLDVFPGQRTEPIFPYKKEVGGSSPSTPTKEGPGQVPIYAPSTQPQRPIRTRTHRNPTPLRIFSVEPCLRYLTPNQYRPHPPPNHTPPCRGTHATKAAVKTDPENTPKRYVDSENSYPTSIRPARLRRSRVLLRRPKTDSRQPSAQAVLRVRWDPFGGIGAQRSGSDVALVGRYLGAPTVRNSEGGLACRRRSRVTTF